MRPDVNVAFPMRGFVNCDGCGNLLTANWSKGSKGTNSPYYLFRGAQDCENYGKSIPQAKLEGAFETLLRSLQPSANFVSVIKEMFKDIWEREHNTLVERRKAMAAELGQVDKHGDGAPDEIRTHDLRFRKPALYPAELRVLHNNPK